MSEIVQLGGRVDERKRPCEVLYRTAPCWLVPSGEHEGRSYPDDYAGRVTSVKPLGRRTAAGKPKSFGRSAARHNRGVAVLSLTEEEASLLEARKLKLVGEPPRPEPVTFEDRWGAVASGLESMRAILEDETLAASERPIDRERADFVRKYASALLKELPRVEVHSGSGYYRVDSSDSGKTDTVNGTPVKDNGTSTITLVTGGLTADAEKGKRCIFDTSSNVYVIVSNTGNTLVVKGDASAEAADDGVTIDSFETWQAGLDKLYAEQGTANFTAAQVVEGYDGTYTEHVLMPAFEPQPLYQLTVRAASGQTNVIITADDTDHTLTTAATSWHVTFQGLEFDHTGGGAKDCLRGNGGYFTHFRDCTFKQTSGAGYVYESTSGDTFFDCVFDTAQDSRPRGSRFYRCWFKGNRLVLFWCATGVYDSCLFSDGGLYSAGAYPIYKSLVIRQCVFYDSLVTMLAACFDMRNTIMCRDDGGQLLIAVGIEAVSSDHNCFYTSHATPFAWNGTNKTFAEWQALGHDANSKNEDPKMTDPAGDDFSLQSDSPCRRRGAGAGVELDKNGDGFDAYNPDIGAYSTGSGIPDEPAVESVTTSGATVTVGVSGEGRTNCARLLKDGGEVDDEASHSGSGAISLTSSEEDAFRTAVAWSERGERARSKPVGARPPRYFLSGGATTDEIASGIVSALESSQALAGLLGSSDAIYLSHPPKDAELPCLVYELALGARARGVVGELRLSSWAKTAGAARAVMEEAANVLQAGRLETLNYVVRKPIVREAEAEFDRETGLRSERATLSFRAHRK